MTAARPVRAPAGTPTYLAILEAAVPAIDAVMPGRSMVSRWDDHLRPGETRADAPHVALIGGQAAERG